MKRVVTHGVYPGATGSAQALAKEAAAHLLERSIRFGHGRLSIVRLAMAVRSGALVPDEHWVYCRQVASSSKDASIQALFLDASEGAAKPPEISRFPH